MSKESNGQALIAAIQQGDCNQVCSLLDAGFSPDTWDDRNIPGLVIAAQKGYTNIVEILLAAEANFATPGIAEPQECKGEFGGFRASGPMAIWTAAVAGHQDILQILKFTMPEMFGQALVSICERGSLAALHTLLAVIYMHQYYIYGPYVFTLSLNTDRFLLCYSPTEN